MSIPNSTNFGPLPADPSRQANAMLSACQYQVLQTVSAWIDLSPEDLLVLEGAEDFDIHTKGHAEAVQVKASPKPISLGHWEAQEAINNFWQLRLRTPGRNVKFRFLTRATFAVERGKPFGAGIAGLELWQRPSQSDDNVRQLTGFLRRQTRLDLSLRQWLKTASYEQIRADLLRSVVWETHAGDSVYVESGIHSKLLAFGDKRGEAPTSSEYKRLAEKLEREVWITLRRPTNRHLDRFRLEELWEESTRVSIRRAEFDSAFPNRGAIDRIERFQYGTPPLPQPVLARESLCKTIRSQIEMSGLVNLHGSTRMGKTTLAKLVAAPDSKHWSWWSATRRNQEEIDRAISALTKETAASPEVFSVLLDDLDFSPTVAPGFENALGELIATVRGRRGRVLITSHKPLPTRLQVAFGLSPEQVIAVPRLNVTEIAQLAAAFGCDDERLRSLWARFIRTRTKGHPGLVAVQVFALRERGWPQFSRDTINFGQKEADAEKTEARLLLGTLPESQRAILHRLSVFPQRFRRDHAVSFGGISPPLPTPGDLFDSLVGPWIEPLHGNYFVLSPLIEDCAIKAIAEPDFRRLQEEAAEVLVHSSPLSTTEGSSAFLLYWATRNQKGLVGLLLARGEMSGRIFAHFAEDLWWFTSIATKEGELLFNDNLTLSGFLRTLQFDIATVAAPERAPAILNCYRWELENGPQRNDLLARLMFATHSLPQYEVELPPATVVALLCDIDSAVEAHPEMAVRLPQSIKTKFAYIRDPDDLLGTMAFLCTNRCNDLKFLDGFLRCLQVTPPQLRKRILTGFANGGMGARLAVNRAWLAEADLESPDWPFCIAVLERTFSLACEWQFPSLAVAAMQAMSIILDENLGDHKGAHEAIDRMATVSGDQPYLVHDRRACVFLSEKNFAAAEDEWRLALSLWPQPLSSIDHWAAFAARGAGIAAARQGHWDTAANWFQEIVKRLPADEVSERTWQIAGANADVGFALWKAGCCKKAVNALIEAWRTAELLPAGKENLRAFHTRKIVGHVIAWVHGEATGKVYEDLAEPIPGMCSNADFPEKVRELQEGQSAPVWLILTRLERLYNAGDIAARLGSSSIATSTNPVVRWMDVHEQVTHCLFNGEVKDLPELIISDVAAATQIDSDSQEIASLQSDVFHANEPRLGCAAFVAALVTSSAGMHPWQETLAAWRKSIAKYPSAKGWREWFDAIDTILGTSVEEAADIARQDERSWGEKMLSYLNLLLAKDAPPRDLFLAHVRWLEESSSSPWLREIGETFCEVVEAAWKRAIDKPALLSHPRINIPAIREACETGVRGTAKAARIVLAASPAVDVRLGPKILKYVRSLATA